MLFIFDRTTDLIIAYLLCALHNPLLKGSVDAALVKVCDGLSGLSQLCTHYPVHVWFTAAPALTIPKPISNVALTASQVDYYAITK